MTHWYSFSAVRMPTAPNVLLLLLLVLAASLLPTTTALSPTVFVPDPAPLAPNLTTPGPNPAPPAPQATTLVPNASTPAPSARCDTSNSSAMHCLNDLPCVHGTCVKKVGAFGGTDWKCDCDEYWMGPSCDRCCDLECVHGGCYSTDGQPKCLCEAGWVDVLCDVYNDTGLDRGGHNDTGTSEIPGTPIVRSNCSAAHRNVTTSCNGKDCNHGFCQTSVPDERHPTHIIGICVCDPGWKGFECRKCCDLECNHGDCDFFNGDEGLMYCNCHNNYTGHNCTEVKTLPPTPTGPTVVPGYYWYVVGVTVAILIIIIVAGSLLLYFLYKKRNYFLMKMVYRIKNYEDENDGREFDAFICYRSGVDEDRLFVVRQMFPLLEQQHGFKLCIDHRDFEPGEVISNNVIKSINNSRSTIMLLSPDFCDSEWTQFEYQRAQIESISKHHRIIPILFKDISQVKDMDINLQHIIKTITYLVWPGEDATDKEKERFWKKLIFSLPKKRPPPVTSDTVGHSNPSFSPNTIV